MSPGIEVRRWLARRLRAWAEWLDCGCQPPHYLILCKRHGVKPNWEVMGEVKDG